MSRIPKPPMASSSKENSRPGPARNAYITRTLASAISDADKKSLLLNHTKPFQNGPVTRTLASGISDADKKSLLLNHTKPFQNGPANGDGGPSRAGNNKVPAPRFKRSQTVPIPTYAPPAKVAKIERKPLTAAPKIAPYDFKAKFNHLLEKHKIMKSDYTTLKEQHDEVSEEYEKVKEAAQSTATERDHLKEKLLTALSELQETSAERDRLKIDCEIKNLEIEDLRRKNRLLDEVANNLKKKSEEFDRLQSDYDSLTRRHNSLKEELEALTVLSEHLKKVSIEHEKLQLDHKETQMTLTQKVSDADALQNILASMYKEQRDLRNTIQDLKGNIRVYCRVRPPIESEQSKPLFSMNMLDACTIEVDKVELCNSTRKGKHSFTFDGIFTPHSTQEDVFAEVSCMVQSALDGYNVCIFAYGQTGSGKTYTMEGGCGKEQYGIIPRAFNMIFTCMDDLKRMGWQLTIKASFLEIYNEVIYDLLNSSKSQEAHDIKMVDSKGTDVYVSNLKEEEVKSSHDFIKLMIFAQRNRQTAATLNNERSSRSHSVAQIKISAIHDIRKEKYTSNLNLVDLAGSESGKTTQRMDETKHINRSLSELSKVILSLQKNQAHIPYRNSKLTHLLMPSLGGNSKTLMLVNINQFDECFSETLNSLRFATKVNSCRVIKAKKNLTMVDSF